MNSANVQFQGMKEARDALKKLDAATEKKICRQGVRAGAKVWKTAALAEAPRRTGKLDRALKVRAGRSPKGAVSAVMGMKPADFGDAFYGYFIIFGWRVGPRHLGDARHHVPANNFLARAFDRAKDQAQTVAIETMRQKAEEELKK